MAFIISLSVFYLFFLMDGIMAALCNNNEIYRPIVSRIAIYVMDKFIFIKTSFKNFFHDNTMFKELSGLTRNTDIAVSLSMNAGLSPSFSFLVWGFTPSKFCPAFRRACLRFWMLCKPFLSTYNACYFFKSYPFCFQRLFVVSIAFLNDFTFWKFHDMPPSVYYGWQVIKNGGYIQ